MEFSSMN